MLQSKLTASNSLFLELELLKNSTFSDTRADEKFIEDLSADTNNKR